MRHDQRLIDTLDADGRPMLWPLFAWHYPAGHGVTFSGWESHWPGGQHGARFPTAAAALDDAERRWSRIDAIRRRKIEAETVTLHDGPELQHLVPGVAPVALTVRQLAQEAQRRAGRRGDAPLPSGGLFDDVARLQQDLF